DLPAADEIPPGDPREKENEHCCRDSRGGDECKARLDTTMARSGGGDGCHRRQGSAVEQADDDQGQANRAKTCRLLAGTATNDGDADRLVEASREGHATDGRGSACGGQRQGLRALTFRKEALPAPRLEGVGEEKKDPGGDHEERVGVCER